MTEYRPGDRVALEYTGDPYTRLKPGDEGTVIRYDQFLMQLDISWDSGSMLSMLLWHGDRVRLTEKTGEPYYLPHEDCAKCSGIKPGTTCVEGPGQAHCHIGICRRKETGE